MKYIFEVITYNREMNNLMLRCDMFERGKVLGEFATITLEGEPAVESTIIFKALIDAMTHEECPEICSFIYLDDDHVWWDKNVRVISSGDKWAMLDDIIRHRYPKLVVETGEGRYITNVYKNPNIH